MSERQRFYLCGLSLALLYFATALVALHIHAISGLYAFMWFPSGIALAGLIVFGETLWPWVFFSATAFAFFVKMPWAAALCVGGACSLETWLGAALLIRSCGPQPTLRSTREILIFAILSVGLCSFFGSSASVLLASSNGLIPQGQILFHLRAWWIGRALSGLILGGVLISSAARFRQLGSSKLKWNWEFVSLLVSVFVMSALIYTPLGAKIDSVIVKPYVLFLFVIWASLRFGFAGASSAITLISSCAVFGCLHRFLPPAATGDLMTRITIHQMIVMALGLTGFVIAASLQEKNDALQSRDNFLSIASHELKTPLTSLKLQLQMTSRFLLAGPTDPLLKRIEDAVQISNGQVDRISKLIDTLLDITRIQSGKIEFDFQTINFSKLISDTVDKMGDIFSLSNCQLNCSFDKKVFIRADSFRMEQVIVNLLSNAAKYGRSGPIALTVKEEHDCAEFLVSDNGMGIPKERLSSIFQRFERGVSNKSIDGLGLGLYIAREIIKSHAGSISVESVEGKGSTFIVRIPRTALV